MYHRLNQLLQVNNTLVTEQQSFRKDLPTECAAYSLIYGILHAWNSKIHVAGMFCELALAFECINHKILISMVCSVMGKTIHLLTGSNLM